MTEPIEHTDAVVIGAGVIGCAIAWRLGQAGMRVVVVERGRVGGEASHAAAGMLAPLVEAEREDEFFNLTSASLAIYSDLARESGVNSKAGRGKMEELVLALSLDQRGEHAGGGVRSFAPDAPPFDDNDAHPGLPQPPRYGATDHARADDDGVSLFDRLGHLGWIRRSFFLSGVPAPLFSLAARVFKTAVGRVDLVIDHRIYRALDPFEDALLEIGQVIGRFFGQARPERVGQIIDRITHGLLFFRHMLIPRHEWDL